MCPNIWSRHIYYKGDHYPPHWPMYNNYNNYFNYFKQCMSYSYIIFKVGVFNIQCLGPHPSENFFQCFTALIVQLNTWFIENRYTCYSELLWEENHCNSQKYSQPKKIASLIPNKRVDRNIQPPLMELIACKFAFEYYFPLAEEGLSWNNQLH